jgi:hypothetical protein
LRRACFGAALLVLEPHESDEDEEESFVSQPGSCESDDDEEESFVSQPGSCESDEDDDDDEVSPLLDDEDVSPPQPLLSLEVELSVDVVDVLVSPLQPVEEEVSEAAVVSSGTSVVLDVVSPLQPWLVVT